MSPPRVLVFQHIACEHPGIFRDFMKEDGIAWQAVELDEGEPIPDLEAFDILMVMGGPMDVWQEDKHPWLTAEKQAIRHWVSGLERPYLGLCLGHQLLGAALGGEVGKTDTPEVGLMEVTLTEEGRAHPLMAGLPERQSVLQWHAAEVLRAPPEAVVLAESSACPVNAMAFGPIAFGIQYHVEVTPQTVREWGTVPAYERALEKALGEGALERLDREVAAALPAFRKSAFNLYRNFKGLAGF